MQSPSIWYPQNSDQTDKHLLSRILPVALSPASFLYAALGRIRHTLSTPYRADIPVICIGNLTLGGTGKTPTAIAVAQHMTADHKAPFFLTRGYGSNNAGPLLVDPDRHTSEEVGDEPLILATHAPTIVSRNRIAGAKLAIERNADIIIMDDGHQNPSLAKDLSIVMVDAQRGFG